MESGCARGRPAARFWYPGRVLLTIRDTQAPADELGWARFCAITTPNGESEARFAGLVAGQLRRAEHRFERTRAEFAAWARTVGERHGSAVELRPAGPVAPELGAPTQLGAFRR